MRRIIQQVHEKKHISYPIYLLTGLFVFASAFIAFTGHALTGINVTAPTNGAFWSGTNNITWSADCQEGDLVNIYYSTDDFDTTSVKIIGNVSCNGTSQYAWDTTAVTDGSSYNLRVTDATDAQVFGTSGTFTIDNTLPIITTVSGVDTGPVQSDTINLTLSDTNGISTSEYGYSADNVCDATDTYGNSFTSGSDFSITGDYTDYLCAKAIDPAGNTTYSVIGQLNVDNTGPTVSLSYNPDRSVRDVDTLVVTATFNESLGGTPTIAIDTTGTDLTATAMSGSGTTWTYSYDVPSGSDGSATATINVDDVAGNVNSAATNASFTIDNTVATFTVNESVDTGPIQADTINVDISDSNTISTSDYGYSVDNVCDATDTYGNSFTSGTDFEITGDRVNYLCVRAVDESGNTGYQLIGQLNTDNTAPVISSVLSDTDPVKSADTITITFDVDSTLSANPSVTVDGSAATYSANDGGAYTYTYTIAGTETEGEVVVFVAATDLAGNIGSSSIADLSLDFTAPVITSIGSDVDPAKSGDNLIITFNVDETLSANPVVTVDSYSASYSSDNAETYTYSYTVTGEETEGEVSINVNASDVPGNTGNTSISTQTLDFTSPGVALSYDLTRDVKDSDSLVITATFDEEISGTPTISVDTSGTDLGVTSLSSTETSTVWTYAYDVPDGSDGIATTTISALDLAGNANSVATSNTFTIDNIAPVVPVVTSPAISATLNAPNYTINGTTEANAFVEIFNEGSVGSQQLSGGETSFGITVSLTQDATNNFTIKSTDEAGNVSLSANAPALIEDSTPPSAAISSSEASPTNSSPFSATFTFAEVVTGFAVGDIAVGNGTAGNFSTSDNTVFTADITPSGDGVVTVDVDASLATDAANNSNTASTQFSIDYDSTPPDVTITSSETSPTNNSPFSITLTFTEAVSGFAVGDITVGNGTAGNFSTSDNTVFTADITPSGDGAVTVDVDASVATDLAGNNNNVATQYSITYDGTPPTASEVTAIATPTNDTTPDITVNVESGATFEIGTGLFPSESGSTILATGTGTGASQVVTLSSLSPGVHNLELEATDAAGNITGVSLAQFTIDTTPPDVTITSSETSPTNSSPFSITLTFTETVSGFAVGDITVGNGTAGNFSTSDNTVFTADITPSGDGAVTVDVDASVATDLAGNNNNVATQYSITYDGTPPTASEVTAVTTPTNDTTPDITVNVEGGATFEILNAGSVLATNTGSGASQILTLAEVVAGTYDLDLVAADEAGNISTTSLTQFIVDTTNPGVVLSDDQADTIVRDADTIEITATFVDVNGINETIAPKITIGSLVTDIIMTKSSNLVWIYNWDVPGNINGDYSASITAVDNAGNANDVATGVTSYTVDNTSPGVTLSYDLNRDIQDFDTLVVTATFDEVPSEIPVIAVDTTGVDLAATNMTGSDLIWTYSYDVPAASDGLATVTISANDTAGNVNTTATNANFTIDNTAPSFTINSGIDTGPVQNDVINISINELNMVSAAEYGYSEDNICDGTTDTYGNAFNSGVDINIGGTHTDYLCIMAIDEAGNSVYELVGQLNTDNILPTLTYVNIVSNNEETDLAQAGDILSILITSDKDIATPTVFMLGSAADSVVQNGDTENWVATSLVENGDTEGLVTIAIDFIDLIGNNGAQVVTTTDLSSVSLDLTAPTVSISGMPSGSTSEEEISVVVAGEDVVYYKYNLNNGSYSSEIQVGTNISLNDLDNGDYTLYVLGRDLAGNWQDQATTAMWEVSRSTGAVFGSPAPPPTTYQEYNPVTNETVEEVVVNEVPASTVETITSLDGTEVTTNQEVLKVEGIVTEVLVNANIDVVDSPENSQVISLNAPVASAVDSVGVELSKQVISNLVSDFGVESDVKVNVGYKQATVAQVTSDSLGEGKVLVDNSIFSINLSVGDVEVNEFKSPLEVVFEVPNVNEKDELVIAWFDVKLNKWIELNTVIKDNKLVANILHLTDFAIIRKSKIQENINNKNKVEAETLQGRDLEIEQINIDADAIIAGGEVLLDNSGSIRDIEKEKDIYKSRTSSLIIGVKDIVKNTINAITNFITYGTKTTAKLGDGERASVIGSYKEAFNKLPIKKTEWVDALKIANGRFTQETNIEAEEVAMKNFIRVYGRRPNMDNPNDIAAINIMAYGIRSKNRDINNEKVAIKTFRDIYRKVPSKNSEWNIVRAVAYSGASRESDVSKKSSLDGVEEGCFIENKFTWNMQEGSVGGRVGELQELLQCLGYFPNDLSPTNFFGMTTKNALLKFQKANNLYPAGLVGNKTRQAINSYLEGSQERILRIKEAKIKELENKQVQKRESIKYIESKTQACAVGVKFILPLSYGNTGPQVEVLQSLLKCLGYFEVDFEVTGYFGMKTVDAVKAFQKDNDMEQAGFVGPKTRALLNRFYSEGAKVDDMIIEDIISVGGACKISSKFSFKLERGDSGGSVKRLQGLLRCLEYYPVNEELTSYFGGSTANALANFQRDNSLAPVGFVGPKTLRALNKFGE